MTALLETLFPSLGDVVSALVWLAIVAALVWIVATGAATLEEHALEPAGPEPSPPPSCVRIIRTPFDWQAENDL